MSGDQGWPTPGPLTPRSSSQPSGAAPDPALRETELLIGRVAARGAVTPRPDWLRSVHERITQEPVSTPSRRFLRAIIALSPRDAAAAFMASMSAVAGRGRVPAIVRAQALAVVLLTVVSVATLGAGGAIVLERVSRPPVMPTPTSPVVPPTPSPNATATPTPDAPGVSDEDPSAPAPSSPARSAPADPSGSEPTVRGPGSEPSDDPVVGAHPPSTPRPVDVTDDPPGSRPTSRPHPTPRADGTFKPHPTPKPDKTLRPQKSSRPRPTPQPQPTAKPDKTPRSERNPKPGRTPKPDATPRPDTAPKPGRTRRPDTAPRSDRTPKPHPTPRNGNGNGRVRTYLPWSPHVS